MVTLLFHRFKQPVVLGYVLAGFIIGPHTLPFALITSQESINTLSERRPQLDAAIQALKPKERNR